MMIRNRVAAFWRRPSKSAKEEVARGVVCCPCGKETPVLVFEAMTKRRATSPDLLAYEAPSQPPILTSSTTRGDRQ